MEEIYEIKNTKETQALFDIRDQMELIDKQGKILMNKINRLMNKRTYLLAEFFHHADAISGLGDKRQDFLPEQSTSELIKIKVRHGEDVGKDKSSLIDLLKNMLGK